MANEPDKIQHGKTPDLAAWDALLLELGRDIERVADRLRGLSEARLAAAAPPHASRAAAARATAQVLADAAAGLEAGAGRRSGGSCPCSSTFPRAIRSRSPVTISWRRLGRQRRTTRSGRATVDVQRMM